MGKKGGGSGEDTDEDVLAVRIAQLEQQLVQLRMNLPVQVSAEDRHFSHRQAELLDKVAASCDRLADATVEVAKATAAGNTAKEAKAIEKPPVIKISDSERHLKASLKTGAQLVAAIVKVQRLMGERRHDIRDVAAYLPYMDVGLYMQFSSHPPHTVNALFTELLARVNYTPFQLLIERRNVDEEPLDYITRMRLVSALFKVGDGDVLSAAKAGLNLEAAARAAVQEKDSLDAIQLYLQAYTAAAPPVLRTTAAVHQEERDDRDKKHSFRGPHCWNCNNEDHVAAECKKPFPKDGRWKYGRYKGRKIPKGKFGNKKRDTDGKPEKRTTGAVEQKKKTNKAKADSGSDASGESDSDSSSTSVTPNEGESDYSFAGLLQRARVGAVRVGPMSAELVIGAARRKTRTTIDSGSAVTLITRATLQKVEPGAKFRRADVRLASVDGSDVPVMGMVTLTVRLDDQDVAVAFYIVDALPAEALIGNDVLDRCAARISYKHKYLKVGKKKYKTSTKWKAERKYAQVLRRLHTTEKPSRPPTAVAVTATKDYVIAPSTAAFVSATGPAHVIRKSKKPRMEAYVRPVHDANYALPVDCLVVSTLDNWHNSTGRVLLHNAHNELPCKIAKGTVVGVISRVSRYERMRRCKVDITATAVNANPTTSMKESKTSIVSEEELRNYVQTLHCLTPQQREAALSVMLKHRALFHKKLKNAGTANVEPMDIKLQGQQRPIRMPMYPRSMKEESASQTEGASMHEAEVIEASRSPWNAPIILVPKKDGTLRFCVDFRRLNDVTVKEAYPMPRVDRALQQLQGSKYFSVFDALSGYWQVPLTKRARELTAFSIPGKGHFHFKVVPMGLTNAPAHFQRVMDLALAGLNWNVCLVYLDDIIVYSTSFEEHLQRLDVVLTRLGDINMKLKFSKCTFFAPEVEFLGHVVSGRGIKPSSRKVEAVRNCTVPKSVSEVRKFLGIVNHFRRFVLNFAERARPLTDLLKGGDAKGRKRHTDWRWGAEQESAFQDLRECLTTAPVLRYGDYHKPFIVNTDASKDVISGALMQRRKKGVVVVEYYSRTLTSAERNYSVTEKELLAVEQAVSHWRRYLYGPQFTVWTDHKPLVGVLGNASRRRDIAPERIGRLVQKLTPYLPTMTVEWVKGNRNVVADALSRCPFVRLEEELGGSTAQALSPVATSAATTAEIAAHTKISRARMQELQERDPELKDLLVYLRNKKVPADEQRAAAVTAMARHMAIVDGVLYMTRFNTRGPEASYQLALPDGDLRRELLRQVHEPPLGVHQSATTLLARLSEHYWWPSMRADVVAMLRDCETCAKLHSPRLRYGELQAITVTERFHTWSVDFAGPWTKTDAGNAHLLVMQDNATKVCELFATPTTSAVDTVDGILRCIVARYGCPARIITDQGGAFISEVMAELCKRMGTEHAFSVARHPQSHGQVENCIKTVERALTATIASHQRDWDRHLFNVQAAINFSPNRTTGVSPFELCTGAAPTLPAERVLMGDAMVVPTGQAGEQVASDVRSLTDNLFSTIQRRVTEAKEEQKRNHDKRHLQPGLELEEGQYVLCERLPAEGLSRKLAPKWDGPYLIVKKVSDVNRRVQDVHNPEREKLVHIGQLKRYDGVLPAPLEKGMYTISEIMEERERNGRIEYRVRWRGYTAKDDMWLVREAFTPASLPTLEEFCKRPLQERRRPVEKKKRVQFEKKAAAQAKNNAQKTKWAKDATETKKRKDAAKKADGDKHKSEGRLPLPNHEDKGPKEGEHKASLNKRSRAPNRRFLSEDWAFSGSTNYFAILGQHGDVLG